MWWVALVACHWTPRETGPDGMVGFLREADSAPVSGQAIETLEALTRTDATGRFAVMYKAPNTEVHFVREQVFYQRRWLPTDGPEVELVLPAQRRGALGCGKLACDVTLTWPLSEGFEARLAGGCAPGASLELGEIPVGTPAMTCRAGLGQPEVPAPLEDRGDQLVASPAPERLVIRIAGSPASCDVWVNGAPAEVAPDRSFSATGRGLMSVAATCDGRPARPAVVPADAGEVTLVWASVGPSVKFEGAVGEIEVQCRAVSGQWIATWVAGADGVFHLPPLEPGACQLVLAPPDLRATAWAAEGAPAAADEITLREVVPGAFKGWLDLPTGKASGRIRVR